MVYIFIYYLAFFFGPWLMVLVTVSVKYSGLMGGRTLPVNLGAKKQIKSNTGKPDSDQFNLCRKEKITNRNSSKLSLTNKRTDLVSEL